MSFWKILAAAASWAETRCSRRRPCTRKIGGLGSGLSYRVIGLRQLLFLLILFFGCKSICICLIWYCSYDAPGYFLLAAGSLMLVGSALCACRLGSVMFDVDFAVLDQSIAFLCVRQLVASCGLMCSQEKWAAPGERHRKNWIFSFNFHRCCSSVLL